MAGWLPGALHASSVLAGACLLVGWPAAWAQAGAAECSAALPQTPACAAQAYAEADDTIAVLYADVRRALSAHERPQLGKEHSAWLRARALSCPAPPKTSATAEALAQQHACLTRETLARRKGLMRWLSMDSPATSP